MIKLYKQIEIVVSEIGMQSFNPEKISRIKQILSKMEGFVGFKTSSACYSEWELRDKAFDKLKKLIPSDLYKIDRIEKAPFHHRKGGSYFGSGSHSAGYAVLEGSINEVIEGEFNNGFTSGDEIVLSPIGDSAVIECWDSDYISRRRETGENGIIRLIR